MPIENSHVYGAHGERCTKCARTEYRTPTPVRPGDFADHREKGYQIGEEEVNISLDGFRRAYADSNGAPESVSPPDFRILSNM